MRGREAYLYSFRYRYHFSVDPEEENRQPVMCRQLHVKQTMWLWVEINLKLICLNKKILWGFLDVLSFESKPGIYIGQILVFRGILATLLFNLRMAFGIFQNIRPRNYNLLSEYHQLMKWNTMFSGQWPVLPISVLLEMFKWSLIAIQGHNVIYYHSIE